MSITTIPKDYKKLQLLLKEIVTGIDVAADFLNHSHVESIEACAWAWDPVLKKVSAKAIDRCSDVLHGPIYTCDGYEWPEHNSFPMAPLIQLDLDHCRELSGINLGSGLLQVWIGHKQSIEASMVRIIPKNFVSKDRLLPIPNIDPMLNFMIPPDWRIDLKEDCEDMKSALQISGYKRKRFTSQLYKGIQEEYGKARNLTSVEIISDKIKEFDTTLESNKRKWSPSNSHLFGTFDPIQYSANERDTPLFCFEADYGFDWGDGGNAQLFFRKDEAGNVSYYMDWSCY